MITEIKPNESKKTAVKPYAICGDYGGVKWRNNHPTDMPCERKAGFNTDHLGRGKCGRCGNENVKRGTKPGRPVTTGRNVSTNKLNQRMKEYKNNPELLTLNTGLEATQSMLDILTERIGEEMGKEVLNLEMLIKLVESVNNCANALYNGHKSIASIEHSTVLTAKEYASFNEGIKHTVKELNIKYGDAGEYMIRCFESYSVLKNSIKAIEE